MEIMEYDAKYKDDFKKLNYEWLEKYFKIEPIDKILLANPEKEILAKGGFVFFAVENGEALGTVALLKISDIIYEVGKMAVNEKYQGKGIGKLLLNECLKIAENEKLHKLVLYSHSKLAPALKLYHSVGFRNVEVEENTHYERADVKMELILT